MRRSSAARLLNGAGEAAESSMIKTRLQRTGSTPAAAGETRYGDEVFGIDFRALACFRIALATLLLADLVQRAGDLAAHYSDSGVLPRVFLGSPFPLQFTPHAWSGSVWCEGGLFVLAALVAGALLVGYRSWIATLVSWLLLSSLHARNPLVLQGSDVLLRLLLFWSLFLPLGAARPTESTGRTGQRRRFLSLGSAAVLIQFAAVYLFTAALKRHPWWTDDNTAIFQALSVEQFTQPLARHLLNHPDLLKAATYAVYRIEWLAPLLVFLPWATASVRLLIIATFVALHCGMMLTLHLGLFPWVCLAGWLLFVPTRAWDWLEQFQPARRALARARGCPGPPPDAFERLPVQLAAGAVLVLVLLWNVRTLELPQRTPHARLWYDDVLQLLRLEQRWTMFAPRPTTDSGWNVAPARLANGEEIDLCRPGGALTWAKPASVADTYLNQHWRKYLIGLRKASLTRFRQPYLEYLCRQWNETHGPAQRVVSAELYVMLEDRALKPPKNALRKVRLQSLIPGSPENLPLATPASNTEIPITET